MKNIFNLTEKEKNRIRRLHLNESMDEIIKPYEFRDTKRSISDAERCENCEKEFQWQEVPSGWDENYCESCNDEYNAYECMNCREEVENPDTWCSRECYKEYHQ